MQKPNEFIRSHVVKSHLKNGLNVGCICKCHAESRVTAGRSIHDTEAS